MHIVAMSSSTMGIEPRQVLLNQYICDLAGTTRPKVCFLATAVGDMADEIVNFYHTFTADRYEPSHLGLFNRTVEDLRSFILKQDIIYVAGGNTANLLAIWRTHGLDLMLREAWERDVVLCGNSAGGLCWFESGITDSFGASLTSIDNCLGFLSGSFCPHYDSEARRRPVYSRCVAEGLAAGWAIDDGIALHYEGTKLRHVLSAVQGARAFRLERVDGEVHETAVSPEPLW
jgi:dipeptidase E